MVNTLIKLLNYIYIYNVESFGVKERRIGNKNEDGVSQSYASSIKSDDHASSKTKMWSWQYV